MKEGKIKIWFTVVFVVAVVVYLVLVSFRKNETSRPAGEFKGPTGTPYVKGPSGPPPGSN
jgi:hypothetical protein